MTVISPEWDVKVRPNTTQWSGYPLPPDLPRYCPSFNSTSQYLLPSPSTGRITAYSRATTVAGVLDDRYGLELWKQRQIVAAVLSGVRIQMAKQSNPGNLTIDQLNINKAMAALWGTPPDSRKFNDAINLVNNLQGGRDAPEFGEAVHAWLAALDIGLIRPCDIPPIFAEHVAVYRELLLRHGLEPIPAYVERVVLADGRETIVGTLDRIFRILTTGEQALGDIKTAKAESLQYSILEFCVQLAVYRYARLMLSLDGTGWEDMPALNFDTAYLMHIPSDHPKQAACIALSTSFGSAGLTLALAVRDLRRRVKTEGLTGTIPIPSESALMWAAARHEIQDITDPRQLPGIWEKYKAVWSDDLTALGHSVAQLVVDDATARDV